jgi:alkylation response protein AidB-like acyl-CoA dehydrogenase
MVDKRWGGTMVLTEPDAGSDVGAGVTMAVKVEENGPDDLGSIWHLEGVKRFITSADYQGHENTVHLVLARPKGGAPGTKGLRLFIVPKYLVNEDGSLGARNGVTVTNIEKKMGIKGSATCELTMGADADLPCIGYLVGEADNDGDGIRQMFLVIEYARMMVGTKAMATLSTGYLNALEYAKIRVQGPDMTRDDGQGRPEGHHHQPPGRAPDPHGAEGPRRGHARAGHVHRMGAGPGRRLTTTRTTPRRTRTGSSARTCSCRS